MKQSTFRKIDDLLAAYPALAVCQKDLTTAVAAICKAYRHGKKLLICGNGGSAADAEHIVGELMKGFILPRRLDEATQNRLLAACPESAEYLIQNLQMALPAISLVNEIGLNTAFANDQAADLSFAQQVLGLGQEGDILLGISTSGNSSNVIYAVQAAKAQGLISIGLSGASGGKLRAAADCCICVPQKETYRIQEYHLPIYHMLCIAAENEFFAS